MQPRSNQIYTTFIVGGATRHFRCLFASFNARPLYDRIFLFLQQQQQQSLARSSSWSEKFHKTYFTSKVVNIYSRWRKQGGAVWNGLAGKHRRLSATAPLNSGEQQSPTCCVSRRASNSAMHGGRQDTYIKSRLNGWQHSQRFPSYQLLKSLGLVTDGRWSPRCNVVTYTGRRVVVKLELRKKKVVNKTQCVPCYKSVSRCP